MCVVAPLLERDAPLGALLGALSSAAAGHGSTALVTGEAGIGKTSLIRAFVDGARGRVLTAACDDLVTPRTLAPRQDAFAQPLGDDVFGTLMDELARERPTVLVIEDAHWADEATLDALGYAARRGGGLGGRRGVAGRHEALQPRDPL